MAWSLNLDATPSLNDSSFRNLPVGEYVYQIVEAGMQPFKRDQPQGEEVVHFGLLNGGITYPVNLRVMDQTVVGEIARKTVKAFAAAVGITGILGVERIKTFKNRWVTVTTVSKPTKDARGVETERVNIQTVDPAEAPGAKEEAPASVPAAGYSAPAAEPEEEASPMDTPKETVRPWHKK